MKIAVTYENGMVFQHFGHTENFKLYDVQDGKIKAMVVVPTNGSGHGALAGFLRDHAVDTLICGGIGAGAQQALTAAGIKFYGGISGDADEAVRKLLCGKLEFDPFIKCTHHEHTQGHSCGGCGEHNCSSEHNCNK